MLTKEEIAAFDLTNIEGGPQYMQAYLAVYTAAVTGLLANRSCFSGDEGTSQDRKEMLKQINDMASDLASDAIEVHLPAMVDVIRTAPPQPA